MFKFYNGIIQRPKSRNHLHRYQLIMDKQNGVLFSHKNGKFQKDAKLKKKNKKSLYIV